MSQDFQAERPIAPDRPRVTSGDHVPHAVEPGRVERRMRGAGVRRAMAAMKVEHSRDLTPLERVANRLTAWAGSTPFLVIHAVWFAIWIAWNSRYVGQAFFGLPAFDPYPFGFLTMVVSLEAIFLSIFVLLSQSRESSIAELREELNLQVNLRMEEEVTKTLQLVAGLYRRLGQELAEDPELREMLQPLDSRAIELQLLEQIRGAQRPHKNNTRTPATTPTSSATPDAAPGAPPAAG